MAIDLPAYNAAEPQILNIYGVLKINAVFYKVVK